MFTSSHSQTHFVFDCGGGLGGLGVFAVSKIEILPPPLLKSAHLVGADAGVPGVAGGAAAAHDETFGGEHGRRGGLQQQGVSPEGALQVHVDAQPPGLQLLPVAGEGLQEGGAAPVHPGGKQVGGAELGCEGLVVAELQLAGEPAHALGKEDGGGGGVTVIKQQTGNQTVRGGNDYHL